MPMPQSVTCLPSNGIKSLKFVSLSMPLHAISANSDARRFESESSFGTAFSFTTPLESWLAVALMVRAKWFVTGIGRGLSFDCLMTDQRRFELSHFNHWRR